MPKTPRPSHKDPATFGPYCAPDRFLSLRSVLWRHIFAILVLLFDEKTNSPNTASLSFWLVFGDASGLVTVAI